MITFFRRLRKTLIGEGNIRKPALPAGRYLLCAIGEIMLVVIGNTCPVRDYLSVETMRSTTNQLCR
jgi:hypothetical protein